MSIIPAFELGFWNAWILVVPMLFVLFSDMRATAARESGKEGDFQLTRREKRIINVVFLPMVVSWVYSVFLPLQLGTAWLYGGLVIYLFGVVFTIAAILNFATSPKDKVITKGLYRFTRNPTYIGLILMHKHVNLLWLEAPHTATLGPLGNLITPLMLVFFSYGGYVRVGQVAEEIKKPRRDIPISLISSLSIVILIYILINTVYHRLLGIEGVRGSSIVASDVATMLVGPAGAGLITILVILSTTSGLNGNTMSSTRVYYAMAKDRLFFKWLDYIHPKFRTPSRAVLIHCFWASVILLIKGNFETIITGQVFINFIFYGLGALAFFKLRRRNVGEKDAFRVPLYPVLPALFIIALLVMFVFRLIVEFEKSLFDLAIVASGIPFFVFWWRRSKKVPGTIFQG